MNWQVKKIGDIGKVCMCKRIMKNQTLPSGDIPFYKIGTFGKKPDAFITKEIYEDFKTKYSFPKKGDILISASGTIGRRVIYDGKPAYFQDSNIVWIDNNETEVLNNYLNVFYGFCNWNPSKGATISRLYNADLRNISISYPTSLAEQQAIVEKLDFAFDAIEKAKANIEKNIENAKELFQSKLFSIFQKGENTYKYSEKKFENICVLQRGFDLPTRLREKGNFPLVSSNGITDYVSNFKVKGPGVTTGRSGTIGKVHFIEKEFWPLNTSLYIKEFHGNNEKFIYYFLQSVDIIKYASGAGVPTLNRNFIHSELFKFIEDYNSQCKIVQILDQLNLQTNLLQEKYKQKLANLEELKKSILEKAFKAELL